MTENSTGVRTLRRRWWFVAAAALFAIIIIICWTTPIRSPLLRTVARLEFLDADARASMLTMSAATGDADALDDVCEIMLRDSDKVFSLVVLEHLWDQRLMRAHLKMQEWLTDEAVAWPNDPRQIRRCDLATYYFRIYVGEGRWDTSKSLAQEVSERDAFRDQVQSHVNQHGLPDDS